MRESEVNSPEKLEYFLTEVEALSSIKHQNIVQIVHVNLNGRY